MYPVAGTHRSLHLYLFEIVQIPVGLARFEHILQSEHSKTQHREKGASPGHFAPAKSATLGIHVHGSIT